MLNMVPSQEIGLGGECLATLATVEFAVEETLYPRRFVMGSHRHDRGSLCVLLEGAFTEQISDSQYSCQAPALLYKPPGMEHGDRFHEQGARCLNVALDRRWSDRIRAVFPRVGAILSTEVTLFLQVHRISMELRRPDEFSPLVVEALVRDLLVSVLRTGRGRADRDWVEDARAILHARFPEAVRLSNLALAVHKHPAHLAQQFRRRFGASIGEYVRKLRVDLVARRLASGERRLAELAVEAGFADQSHMQRVFKRALGVTPDAFRRAHAKPPRRSPAAADARRGSRDHSEWNRTDPRGRE